MDLPQIQRARQTKKKNIQKISRILLSEGSI